MNESQTESSSQDFTDQFWNFIENDMGCVVPKYLKLVLRVRGYDNAASIGTLTSNDIQKLQEFFRAKFKKDVSSDAGQDRKDFFHAFHNDSDEFEILPGHVKLLDKVVSYINAMTESNGPGYFNTRFEKNVRKPVAKVAAVRRKNIRGPRTISQTLAQSKFVDILPGTQNATAQSSIVLVSGQSLDTPAGNLADEEAKVNIESDGSLEKFITDERIHLISIIKVWMQKNVLNFFERYSDQLVPEILEAVMEKSISENGASAAIDGNDEDDMNAGTDDLMVLVFIFICPMCEKPIRSTQQPTKNGESVYFSLSNIERHWKIHAQDNQPKKPKKAKVKKTILCKSETRKLRSKACDTQKPVSCDEAEFELATDDESGNESPGDFKIVPKRKHATLCQN